ncbi:MAG: hypothetical protein AVDCRST_MAG89-4815, partial [uncultured Gemmatimonadetes bacterium]
WLSRKGAKTRKNRSRTPLFFLCVFVPLRATCCCAWSVRDSPRTRCATR